MASCECCWADRWMYRGSEDAYQKAMASHEERGCVCTRDTPEGARVRAGHFWDGERDSRDPDYRALAELDHNDSLGG